MIERYVLIFWAFWIGLILLAAFRVLGFGIARRWQDRKWRDRTRNQQQAAVIIPVKGFDLQATPRFFDSLFAQDYSNYRVLVTFESWHDPVAVWLKEHLDLSESDPVWEHPDPEAGLRSITLVCAGISQKEGQKVHNQIAAFRELTSQDAVIAFADADIVFGPDWLSRLLAPINLGTHPLSTTYRWLVPKRPTLANQFASVINGSIATQGGAELTTVLWGGSMALKRKVFDELDVPILLSGSLNDDLRLSKAARRAGNKIAFIRSLILPTPVDFTWRSFFEFAKRQYTQVKFFSPILYTGTNIVLGLYAIGALSIIGALAYGYFYAWIPIAAAYVIDQFRGLARQQVYLALFPENEIRRKLFSACWLEHMLTPVWMLMHWLLLVSTWTQNQITWAGVQYRIISKSKTQILRRPDSTAELPVGVPGLALIAGLHDQNRRSYEDLTEEDLSKESSTGEKTETLTTITPHAITTAPVSHPGISSFITPLASAPPRFERKVLPLSSYEEVACRTKPLLLQTPTPRVQLATELRYQAIPETLKAPVATATVEINPAVVPPLTQVERFVRSRQARAETFPKPALAQTRSHTSHRAYRFENAVEKRLRKSRQITTPRFSTNPSLAISAPPTPPVISTSPNKSSVAPLSSALPLSRSFAATRVTAQRRDRRVGPVARRSASSSRANQVGSSQRGSGSSRPVSRGASGRPN